MNAEPPRTDAALPVGPAQTGIIATQTHPPLTREDVRRDIAIANQFRMEFIKHQMSLATAVLVFTVSFIKEALPQGATTRLGVHYIGLGWLAMALSMVGGLAHMLSWERFYISYRDYDFHGKWQDGKAVRKGINALRICAAWVQTGGFVIGLFLITYFYYLAITTPQH